MKKLVDMYAGDGTARGGTDCSLPDCHSGVCNRVGLEEYMDMAKQVLGELRNRI